MRLAAVSKHNHMAFHRPHFLEQLQWIECAAHLTQLDLGVVGHRFGRKKPLARRLGRMVSLGHLCSLAVPLKCRQ
jgi:hypothetical protein